MISVIIPTCHRNDLLALCLERLAPGAQTLPEEQYEVIVTDDGSRSTAETLVQERFPWARWLAGPRKGPAANRNHGASRAQGEWLAFTDDDCLPAPGWLAGFADGIRDGQDVYEGKTTCAAGLPSPLYEAPTNLTGGNLWSCNVLVRRAAFHHVGGFDENFPNPAMEDVDFRDRLVAAGHPFVFTPDAEVDHPPRHRRLWKAGTLIWEAHTYYWHKINMAHPVGLALPLHMLKCRVRLVQQYPLSRDTLIMLASLLVEMGYVFSHQPAWERKYRAQQHC